MTNLLEELQKLLVDALRLPRTPDSISPTARLFGGELELDSVDAVGFILAVEQRYSVEITDRDLAHFPVASLSDVAALLIAKGVPDDPPGLDTGRTCAARTSGQPKNGDKPGQL
jgi:acyl carrier protein